MDDPSVKERELARWKEKDELFQLTDEQLNKQPYAVRYQRMRHEREIEYFEYIKALQMGMEKEKAVKYARERANYVVKHWNSIKNEP